MLKRQVRRTIGSQQPLLPDPSLPVPANKKILVWVEDELLPRDSAKVFVIGTLWYTISIITYDKSPLSLL
jgi:hypothetical protein